jgi:hypothetical protein
MSVLVVFEDRQVWCAAFTSVNVYPRERTSVGAVRLAWVAIHRLITPEA